MSSPRRPPGPPPARPPSEPPPSMPGAAIKRPPGPPPTTAPIASIKPPPNMPPPNNMQQTAQRPGVEGSKKPLPPISSIKRPAEEPPEEAPAKKTSPIPPSYKAGGISMFDEEPKAPRALGPPPRGPPGMAAQAPSADPSVTVQRGPRPPPPKITATGIPEGQPLPPGQEPPKPSKPPPPTRPPPKAEDGGRAPPKVDPEEELRKKRANVQPPTSQPPLLRVKKPKEETPIKRREKDMPELESSDEDEEPPELVKQPLPFGVLKQEIPPVKSIEDYKEEAQSKPSIEPKAEVKADVKLEGSVPAAAKDEESVATGMASKISKTSKNSKDSKPSLVHDAPLVAPDDNIKSNDYVPAAPIQMDKYFDDSTLGKILPKGRISIKCIEGIEIRRKNDQDRIPRNDPFIKFRLGAAERHPWKSTATQRKQDSNPKFQNEVIYFDMLDPIQFIFQDDVQLCIELWNKSTTKNELIGSVSMSVVRFFKQPFVSYVEKVPIYYPGQTRTPMRLVLEIVFEEARSGMAQITFFEANGLRNIDPMGQQDPFVQVSLGKHYKKRTKCIKSGGTNPYFDEAEILMWLDQENWIEDLKVEVLDEDAKEEKPIGSTQFSLLPYMKMVPDAAREDIYDLFYYELIDPKDESEKKEIPCGTLTMRIRFLPAGKLKVFVDRAKDLQLPETTANNNKAITRLDPYTQLVLDGNAVQIVKRTPEDKDGGKDPVWQTEIQFDIVDQYILQLNVMNQNLLGKDILLGSAEISLLNVFRNGQMEFWNSLKYKKMNGGIKEVGDIFIKLSFEGPVGIKYPQYREDVDTFDDTLRKLPAIEDGQSQVTNDDNLQEPLDNEIKEPIDTIPDENLQMDDETRKIKEYEAKKRSQEAIDQEFTDEEITAAFKFIDLDKNNFIGAAEIRHILVCMGEMITDEEIDMMINMVDLDGDGQVSFKEFRALVLHPNPGLVDMHKEINVDKDTEIMKDKQALAGKSQGIDLAAFQRQKELLQREQKKKIILSFIADNEITFEMIQQSYYDYLELPKEKRIGGRVRFSEFCKVMKIEPITEYKNLHAFYDDEETGDMDLREFLLNMMNFVKVEKEARVKFSFEMFDELKTGFIAQREVEEILRGNHILTLLSVKRKAETIMRQANSTKSGSITMKEFVVVSKKFPNILFPASSALNPPKGNIATLPQP